MEKDLRADPVGKPIFEYGLKQPDALFATFLTAHRENEQSPWAPYIRALPSSFLYMPHYHAASLSPILVGTRALEIIRKNVQWVKAAYVVARHCVPTLEKTSFDAFQWGYFAVRTRLIPNTYKGLPNAFMVPLVDMFNHACAPNVHCVYNESQGYTLSAVKNVLAGEELTVSYGIKSNSTLFARYGFTLPDNPTREALLDVSTSNQSVDIFHVRPDFSHTETRRLFDVLREMINGSTVIDLDVEARVLKRLKESAATRASSSLRDHTLNAELVELQKHAMRVAADEQTVLDWFVRLADEACAVLEHTGSERLKKLANLSDNGGTFAEYFGALNSALR